MKLYALNEAAGRLIGWAANEISMDGEWMKITPWGEFDNRVGLQKVAREDGQAMVAAFNSLKSRAARLFRGLPIFVGHPDFEPERYQDKRRFGKITDLQVREDGLYGLVSLNSLGKQVVEDGHYLYVSPAWLLRRDGRYVRPTELVSVGFTNTPQIPGEPWAKNEPEQKGTTMPQWLIDLLVSAGLIKPDATEDEVKTAVQSLLNSKAEMENEVAQTSEQQQQAANEVKTLRAQLKAANDKATGERRARIERELEIAVNTGRIVEADRAAWNARLTANFDAGLQELAAKPAAINTHSQVSGLGQRKQEANASSNKIAAINEAVRKYAADHGINLATNDGYNTAFRAVRQAQPALFN